MKKSKKTQQFLHRRSGTITLKRVSLHPVNIMLLLGMGVLLFGSTFGAFGESTSVSLNITALPLNSPAVITSPADQSRFTVADIAISGECPPDSYVKLYKNEIFNGSALCENNRFQFAITLHDGANVLKVRVFNLSNEEGPVSNTITVYYDPPPPSTSSSRRRTPETPGALNNGLRIITDYSYKIHRSGQPVTLNFTIDGGTPPFAIAIDWGDGTLAPIAQQDSSAIKVEHTYTEKPRLTTYVIKIAVSDTDGGSDYMQVMAAVDYQPELQPSASINAKPTSTFSKGLRDWQKFAWPAYLIFVLMVISFYLGEREEKRILTRNKKLLS